MWNLHPTTRSINSSKSNQLPSWAMYFEGLSAPDYKTRLEHVIRPVFESAQNCGFKEWVYESNKV